MGVEVASAYLGMKREDERLCYPTPTPVPQPLYIGGLGFGVAELGQPQLGSIWCSLGVWGITPIWGQFWGTVGLG